MSLITLSLEKLKYVHISTDTYFGDLHVSALTEQATKNIQIHWLEAFSCLRRPQQIKTDNGLDTLPILLRSSFSVGISNTKQE